MATLDVIPYPETFACASRIEGHSAVVSAGLVRTLMEAGNTRQRRTHRAIPHQISLVFVMPQSGYAEWLTWCNDNAWTKWVEMNLPGLEAGLAGTDTAPILIRFCSDLRVDLLAVHRLWYWRVIVDCQWEPVPPPLGGEIVLGLHLNGDLSDATPRLLAYDTPDFTLGGVPHGSFVAGAGAYGQSAWRCNGLTNPIRSLDLPAGQGNLGPEWQFSAWLKPVTNTSYGGFGGAFLQMLSRASATGGTIGGSAPGPSAFTGQLQIRFGIGGTNSLTVTYPSLNPVSGNVDAISLKTPAGAVPIFPSDGALHHLGIACDLTSVRAYIDGVLVATDADLATSRPAGQRPMWTSTVYANQCFFLDAQFSGGGGYDLAQPWGTASPGFAAFASGDWSEILLCRGPGAVTFVGPTCMVPSEPFVA